MVCKGFRLRDDQFDATKSACQVVSCLEDRDCSLLEVPGGPSANGNDTLLKCCTGKCISTVSDTANCGACGNDICANNPPSHVCFGKLYGGNMVTDYCVNAAPCTVDWTLDHYSRYSSCGVSSPSESM
jgi:hypothetical protein